MEDSPFTELIVDSPEKSRSSRARRRNPELAGGAWDPRSVVANERRIAESLANSERAFDSGMNEIIFLIEEAAEGGFTVRALGESIFAEAETFDTLRQQVRDVVNCHFDEGKAPKVIRLLGRCGRAF